MPIEFTILDRAPVPIASCPECQATPFEPFPRGTVQRSRRPLMWWVRNLFAAQHTPPRPYCALICWACQEIVGYEDPLEPASVSASGAIVYEFELEPRYRK